MRVKIIQQDIHWLDPAKNIDFLSGQMEKNVDLFILPEMCLTGFCMNPRKASISEDSLAIQDLINLCKKFNTAFLGSFAISENDSNYNRALLITKEGIEDRYDKQFLFSPSGENKAFSQRHDVKLFNFKGISILPQICYDLRFPENVRKSSPPDLLVYMANWPKQRIQHWDTLLKARAIENQCYTIGCNREGKDFNNWEYSGHCQLVHPDGSVTMIKEKSSCLVVDIDFDSMKKYRLKYPFLNDKK